MELIILECLAALFLFLSIVRPLVRGLWKLPGLTVCPLLALGILLGIFPAYGFRPECVPLLFFAIFLFIANLSDFLALFSSLQSDAYHDKGLLFTFGSAAAFVFSLWVTFQYAPPMHADLATEGVKTIFLQGDSLHIRVYGPPESGNGTEESAGLDAPDGETSAPPPPPARPLLILLPPVSSSFTITDDVCTALRDRGFTVLTYSRLNFDSPFVNRNGMPVRLSFPGVFRLGSAQIWGMRYIKANEKTRKLEETRKQDTLLLLRELAENRTLQNLLGGINRNIIFLAGYGEGGAALTSLAGEDSFTFGYPEVRGVISIEAPLLSSLEGDPPPPPPPPAPDPFNRFFQLVQEFFEKVKPQKITHISEIPRPGFPVLYILSDRVISERGGRYETIIRTISSSRNAALIAAIPGAGRFDYSASPEHYPLLSALFKGAEQTGISRNWPEVTASLITNFAFLILDNISDDAIPDKIPLVKTALDNNTYLERGGVWHIPDVQSILQP